MANLQCAHLRLTDPMDAWSQLCEVAQVQDAAITPVVLNFTKHNKQKTKRK